MPEQLVLGTRGSALAMAQSTWVARALEARWPGLEVRLEVIRTRGDRIQDRPLAAVGGKGLFTRELEDGLREGRIDLAVHSLKDLPTEQPDGLTLGAVPERADPRDVLVGVADWSELGEGAVVGTGSLRRRVQVLARRSDLRVEDIRGNVDTRLRKLRSGRYRAVVLALAGLERLGLRGVLPPHRVLDPASFTPAPGQGALGVQCRADDRRVLRFLEPLDHRPTRTCVRAERAFLAAVGGGCNVPAGALAVVERGGLVLRAMLADAGGALVRDLRRGEWDQAGDLGRELAEALRRALGA